MKIHDAVQCDTMRCAYTRAYYQRSLVLVWQTFFGSLDLSNHLQWFRAVRQAAGPAPSPFPTDQSIANTIYENGTYGRIYNDTYLE